MNQFYEDISHFREKIVSYTEQIFKYSANELILELEQLNLLNKEDNCLESSTALGFIIEEFLVSKLDEYTSTHDGFNDYCVHRTGTSVTDTSFDCISQIRHGIRALINIKVCKVGSANNAIASIQQLHHDFVETDELTPKCFLVLKVYYSFCRSKRSGHRGDRAILIKQIKSYFLDELDFTSGHLQDHRQWSKAGANANSGRLQISDKFLNEHMIDAGDVSYEHTVCMLNMIYNGNKES